MFGLTEKDIQIIKETLKKYPNVKKALIYGSRAKGTYKPGSDVNIALKGDINFDTESNIHNDLNERSPLPYFFDITPYNRLTNLDLKDHIDRVGIEL